MELKIVPPEITCSWRFKDLRRRQVPVTVEQLVQRDESSTEKVSLYRRKFEFVEALGILFTHLAAGRCIHSFNFMSFWR